MKQLLTLLFIGIASLYAQTVPSYVPTNGLVGWWPFNGNANDESGNGHHGVTTNISYDTNRYGTLNSTLLLNGSGFVELPTLSTLNIENHSFSGWFKTNLSSLQLLIYKVDVGTATDEGFGLYIDPTLVNGNLGYSVKVNGNCIPGVGWIRANSNTTINTQSYYHIAGVTNSDSLVLYVNGQLVKKVVRPNGFIDNCSSSIWIGRDWPSNSQFNFVGNIDELGIWNRALTPQEIQILSTECSDTLESNPQDFTAFTNVGWANFKCKSSDTAATYQWQQSNGAGWVDLTNLGNYSGATSDSLVITGVTSAMNNYGYRCIVTGCTTDTSDVALLSVVNGIGLGESKLQQLTVSPNPTNGMVSLNTSVVGNYGILTLDGRVLESGTAKKDYDLTIYPAGVYTLNLTTDEGIKVLKVVKN
jgi:hypothetical protein